MTIKAWILILILGVSGCSSLPPADYRSVPPQQVAYEEARLAAQVCEAPMRARKSLSPKFKYGCFCGSDHPMVDRSDKEGEIAALYRIKPVDEIDAACQAHDVCWAFNGHEVSCDHELVASLKRYEKEIAPLVGFW